MSEVKVAFVGAGGNASAVKAGYITVNEPAPEVDFIASPRSGDAPLTVQFTSTVTGTVTAYGWNFGDGGTATTANPTHTYQSAGSFGVTLVVTGTGGTASESKPGYITVNAPSGAPTATFSADVTEGTAPLTVTFTAVTSGTVEGWLWTFGDGGQATTGPVVTHVYTTPGLFDVSLTVSNTYGSYTTNKPGYITVNEPAPQVDFIASPRSGDAPLTVQFTSTVSGTVTDEWSGVAQLTIDGQEVTPESDGSFATDVSYDFGLNLIDSYAVDGDGNETEDLRSVLAGSFAAYDTGIGDGIMTRLNEGGFDTIEVLGEDLINSQDLSALIPSPVFSDEQEYCVDLGWLGEYCYTLYSIAFYVSNPYIGTTDLQLDPQTGTIYASFVVYDASLDWSASGEISEVGYSASGDVSVDSISVSMYLSPYVSGGQIYFTVSSVSVSSSGFDFYLDSWIYDVLDFFGVDMDSLIQGYMEDAIEGAIEDEVPALLEDVLQGLELGASLPVLDNTYELDAMPYSISVDDAGLTLSLETWLTADTWMSDYSGLGSLYAGYTVPTYASTPGMVLSLSLDFLNQALYAFWGGGILDMTMTGDDLGLDVADLQMLFPDMEELNITTRALLPPVLIPGTGASLTDLQIGDLLLTMYGGPMEPGNEMLQVYLHVFGELDIAVTDTSITPSIDAVEVYFDVVQPDSNTLAASDTEDLLEALVPLFLPVLTEALSEIPIPAIQGFTLANIGVSAAGAENGYANIEGDLASY